MLLNIPEKRKPRVHFSGIGGTAMVSGAKLALELGWEVRGSDNPLYPPTSEMVKALGVPVFSGYAAANLDWNPDIVIIGNVLSRGNPEVEAVLERRLHYVSLPEWLKDAVLRHRRPVVISGTHGKTTTTALTAFLLDRCGLSPGFLIGGQPLDFPFSARIGDEGAPFVIEGDEYDTAFFDKRAKFFHYLPEIAVVTSLEFDHGDIYRSLDEIERAFRLMLRQIPRDGHLLLCTDDPGAMRLAQHAFCEVSTYGFSPEAHWRGREIESADGATLLEVKRGGAVWTVFKAPLYGRHNLLNTLAAIAVAGVLGIEPEKLREVVPGFSGVRRRMEVFLETESKIFIDDFAHHPTAVQAVIAAARERWKERRLCVLFEPRSNTTATNRFQDQLGEAFTGADEVWIGPVHRGERIPAEERLDRRAVVETLKKRGIAARFTDEPGEIVRAISARRDRREVILILSNGSFGEIYAKFRESFPGGVQDG